MSLVLRPRTAQVPRTQLLCLGMAPLPAWLGSAELIFPSGMPLLSLDAVLQGEVAAPLSKGRRAPATSPAPEQGGTGDGWGGGLNLSHFLCKSTRVQAQAAPWGRGRQPCSTALSHAPQAENTLNAFLLLICSFVSSSHQCRQPTSDGAFQMISLATFANMSLSLLER